MASCHVMAQLVIGLGNRGGEYANTRHNIGWMCLDELEQRGKFGRERGEGPARVREGSIDGFDIVTARPQTYMNLSGRAGIHLTDRLGVPPSGVIVVYDDADLPLGRLRLRRGGSAGGHRGVQSLMDSWKTQDFMRLRIGIGRPQGDGDLIEHVLDRFEPAEREAVRNAVARAADAVIGVVRDGLDAAMAQFNRAAAD